MKTQQKPSLKRNAIAFFGVIAIVAIVAIVYTVVDRPTALIVGGILGALLFAVDMNLKNAEAKAARAIAIKTAQEKQPDKTIQEKPSYTEEEIKELVLGLWATKDPNEIDYRDGIMRAGYYRRSCANALRQLGKEAIPYLEPYADRKEVVPLLKELTSLPSSR